MWMLGYLMQAIGSNKVEEIHLSDLKESEKILDVNCWHREFQTKYFSEFQF
jgi:hypothetical protein